MKKPTAVMRALWWNRARRNANGGRRCQFPIELLEQRIVPFTTSSSMGMVVNTVELIRAGEFERPDAGLRSPRPK